MLLALMGDYGVIDAKKSMELRCISHYVPVMLKGIDFSHTKYAWKSMHI